MEKPLEVDFAVTLELPPAVLNVMLKAVEELPYKLARPVMDFIHPQIFAQAIKRHQGGQGTDNAGTEAS